MKAYSMDLRRRVLASYDVCGSSTIVAKKFDVSPAWVRRLVQRRRDCGEIAPRSGKCGRKHKLDHNVLAELVAQQPDATLEELREKLGVACSLTTVHNALHALRLTFKKNGAGRGTRSARRRGTSRDLAGEIHRPESE